MTDLIKHYLKKQGIFEALSYTVISLFFLGVFWNATAPWLYKYRSEGHIVRRGLVAGKHFAEEGFIRSMFLPVYQPGKVYHIPEEYYTHYPPLSDIINGIIRKLGFHSLLSFRFPFIITSTLAALFWFLFLKNTYGSLAGFLGVLFLAILPEFFNSAYIPNHPSLDQFYRFAAIYIVDLLFSRESKLSMNKYKFIPQHENSRYQKMRDGGYFHGKKKRVLYILLWLVMFFQSITSYEYIVYLQLYVWLYAFLFSISEKKKLIWLASAPALGLLLHFMQIAWALGGASNAISELMNIYIQRSGAVESQYLYSLMSAFRIIFWNSFSIILGLWQNSTSILFVIVTIVSLLELKKLNQIDPFWRYLLLFFVCDISWYVIVPAHAFNHFHNIKVILPTVTFLVGILFYFNIEFLRKEISLSNKIPIVKFLIIVILFSFVYLSKIWKLDAAIRDNLTSGPKEYEYRALRKFLPEGAICLTSVGNDACFITYYLDRRTYHCNPKNLRLAIMKYKEKPFFNKDKIYFISDKKYDTAVKDYLLKHSKEILEYKDAIIYRLIVDSF